MTTQEEWHAQRMAECHENADESIPVRSGDTVEANAIAGHTDGMMEDCANGWPATGTVVSCRHRDMHDGPRNLSAEWVITVRFPESDCAVYKGTKEVYPVGHTRDSWEECPLSLPSDD